VKHSQWTVVILGLSFVLLASIIPRVDAAGTAFNETDTPVNLTAPLFAQSIVGVPTLHSVVISGAPRMWCERGAMMCGITPTRTKRASGSLLSLLGKIRC
jgi:hypothetical protein